MVLSEVILHSWKQLWRSWGLAAVYRPHSGVYEASALVEKCLSEQCLSSPCLLRFSYYLSCRWRAHRPDMHPPKVRWLFLTLSILFSLRLLVNKSVNKGHLGSLQTCIISGYWIPGPKSKFLLSQNKKRNNGSQKSGEGVTLQCINPFSGVVPGDSANTNLCAELPGIHFPKSFNLPLPNF